MHVPAGTICLWHGSIDTIPANWALCDGTNGTPDLKGRFIVGAGSTYNPGESGGEIHHRHNLLCDAHAHGFYWGYGLAGGDEVSWMTSYEVVTGVTEYKDNLPPYYALCYIMKL